MPTLEELEASTPIELKKLSPVHKQVAALVAQGVDRRTIAAACDYVPEYITWLQGQPLFIEYIKTMNRAVATQLEALFGKAVGVIDYAMTEGNVDERLKGAKLQLEATGRIGRFATILPESGGQDRLEQLAGRLVELLKTQRRVVYEDEGIQDAEIIEQSSYQQVKSAKGSDHGQHQ
jgi:hypothetical protein